MFLRHTTANENDVDTWAPGHLSTWVPRSVFPGGIAASNHGMEARKFVLRRKCADSGGVVGICAMQSACARQAISTR